MAITFPELYRSTVGKKAVMAITGGILVLFLIGHMVGNLKVFLGAADFDHYAAWLRTVGEPALPHRWFLSGAEAVLAVSVVAHLWSAVSLARTARHARPVKYAAKKKSRANGYAVYTMRYGGIVIVLFLVWHLLDLTAGVVNPMGDSTSPYVKVVAGFAPTRWYITLFYLAAVVMVGLHLRHGIRSAFQTLGVAGSRVLHDRVAAVVSTLLVLGFLAVPAAVTVGWVK